jgi:hypothetical protein
VVLAIIAIWAIIIPLVVLAISWESANRRQARAAQAKRRTGAKHLSPRCVLRTTRPRRTVTRRRCPELPRTRRRPASA